MSRSASTCRSTPSSRRCYIPYEVAKIDTHRRIAASRDAGELDRLREELDDRFGPPPEPVDNLIRLQEARINFGRAGARSVEFKAGRLVIAPIELELGTGEGAPRAPARGGLRIA